MKIISNKIIWLGFFSVIMLFNLSSCRKYKPEFEYNNINEVGVNDTLISTTVRVKLGDTLRLTPQISQTDLKSEDNLEFLWTSYEMADNINSPVSELSKEKNLVMPVGFPFVLGKTYKLTLKIFDLTTKISRYKQYNVSVDNDLVEGWIVTEDTPEGADFSMVLPSGRVLYNLYSTINGPLKDKALSTEISGTLINDGISPNRRKIYMMTENNGFELDYLTFSKTYDFNALFFTAPGVTKPTFMNWYSRGVVGSIINDGKLHTNIVGGFPGSKKWSGQLVAAEVGLNYKLAPFVANGIYVPTGQVTGTTPQYYQAIVYDQLNKRFFAGVYPITQLIAFPANRSTLFDLNNVGMDMVHMDLGGGNYLYNMIMKDASNDYYFMQVRTTFSMNVPAITMTKHKMNVPDMNAFSSASTSFISPYMFFSTANKVYRYEPGSNTAKLQHAFPANEQVVKVRCVAPLGEAGFNVAVATWDGIQGRLYLFPLALGGPNAMEISNYSKVYSGFKKIVDVQYKAR